jgi:hypothetical protein
MKWTAYIWNGDFFYAGDPAARLTGCSPRNIRITPGTQPGDRISKKNPVSPRTLTQAEKYGFPSVNEAGAGPRASAAVTSIHSPKWSDIGHPEETAAQ